MQKPNGSKPDSDIFARLTRIYQKFSRARRINHDSQMCQFWADPTVEILVGSDELDTIESEFGITFDGGTAMELYDMKLAEAAVFIGRLVKDQNAAGHNPDDFVEGMSSEMAKRIIIHLWKNSEDLRPVIMLAKAEIEFERNRK